jgi:hypothetical protein
MFRRNVLPPSAVWNGKPSRQAASLHFDIENRDGTFPQNICTLKPESGRHATHDNIVTCYDTGVRCLQVILTPTCRVSGYPRQVIEVDAAETTTLYLDSVTDSYNTYNNYTTRHL